jgi:hypothetical protein
MTTWNELVGFLATNYTCTINGTSVSLPYSFPDGRSQNVFVNLDGNEERGEWVYVTSAIADISHIGKLEAICRMATSRICGGVIIDGTFIVLRDAMPLENMDSNEINGLIGTVVGIADELEQMFTGENNF